MKRLLIIFYFFTLILQSNAQRILTLDECCRLAVENNKQSQLSNFSLKQAELQVKNMESNFLPKFSASGGYLYANKDFIMELAPSFSAGLNLNNSYFAGLQLEQPIYTGGKIIAAHKMALTNVSIAHLNKKQTDSDIRLETEESYWNLVKAKELFTVSTKYKEAVQELYKNVNHSYKNGIIPKNELLKVQVKLNEAILSERRAENAIHLSRMDLCHKIGLPLSQEIEIAYNSETTNIPFPEKIPFNVENRYEYQILRDNIYLKEQKIKAIRSEFLPQIGLVAGYNYMNGIKMNNKKFLSDDIFAVMLAVKVPLFHWGEGRRKIKSAKIEKQMAELQQSDLAEAMQLEVAQSTNMLDEAKLEVKLTESAYQQAKENLYENEKSYHAGMETLSNYLEAQAAWQKAWSELVIAKATLHIAYAKYLKSIAN